MISRLMRFSFAFAAVLAAVAGARGEDAAIEAELKKLDGEWTTPSMSGGDVLYRFKGKKLEIEAPSRSYTMTITVDPIAKPDKTIDFKIDEAPEDAKGKTSKGIYKLEGDDTLIFCFSGEGDRPTKYEQNGFEQILTKLKRKKKAAEKSEGDKPAPSTKKTVAPKAADGDAPLPVGWPEGTPPGKIEVKKYPAYRSAVAHAKGATVRNEAGLFFSLFNHIQRKHVEMTAPVVMTYEPRVIEHKGERGDVSMEFLYRSPDQGEAGPGVGAVKVEDFPATEFVCLGSQGVMNDEVLRAGVATLREWLQQHKDEWVAAGPPRRLGYHGPMTPVARQWNEIQIPIKPASAHAESK